jgi:hypothetical protein
VILPHELNFHVRPWRCRFQAVGSIRMNHAGNTLRGALGSALQESPETAAWFRPRASGTHPSGFADPPRPFVLRAMHLDGSLLQPGERFDFDLYSFELQHDRRPMLCRAMTQLGEAGIGPARGAARFIGFENLTGLESDDVLVLPLHPVTDAVSRLRVHFLSPTELKGDDAASFSTLFGRARDRVASLRALYGAGPCPVDFRRLGEIAATVRTDLFQHDSIRQERRSSRTGQVHPIGGFTGVAEYSGDFPELVTWLEAAQFTGVGRQTVWGKGAIRVERLEVLA